MKIKNILFRADSSSIIGTGHIMRDLVLASQYKDANIIFAVQDLDGNINERIKESGYKVELLKSNALNEVTELVNKYNINMVVIDHYGIDYGYEKKLKKRTGVKILSLDDTYEKHYCDILLNHNISADKKRYKGLVPKNCELRCGAKYTLLRDEFIKEKKKNKQEANRKDKTIFLAMGGADHSNINIEILKVLQKIDNLKINLVTTTANKNIKELKKYVKNKKWITLHINSNKIGKLMRKSDFAIVTPSVTLNEIYFMQVTFIAIKTASNQEDIYEFIKKEKYVALSRFNKNRLKSSVSKMIKKLDKDE
ncbi:MAG: UDP-2,4-diacetamido-2,4,6-trideoxy-beta-L-altropyranose hydrolase [Epsilonproteobacteria bacterium]|nr:MAG: UDP-2,4-diacetamido-2,4,6-trideoxy-beta-L-altropyranose hydrolase [Campylobacterota bacterium]